MYPIHALYYISSSASFPPTRYVPKWSTPALVICTYMYTSNPLFCGLFHAGTPTRTNRHTQVQHTHLLLASSIIFSK